MCKKKVLFLMCLTLSAVAMAKPEFYGKFNVSFHNVNDGDDSFSELVSNASRIGVQGEDQLDENSTVFYRIELQNELDDGENDDEGTFSQRNVYIGVKGTFGAVMAGHYDTPLKTSQNKIDLFNDMVGDINQVITINDNRESNQVNYTTPSDLGPVQVSVSYIASENPTIDDAVSSSVAFETGGLYLALAYDQNVENEGDETTRAVAQYNINNFQLGGLYEIYDTDTVTGNDSFDGFLVSGQYKINKWALKAQIGQSDIRYEGAETFSVGADYILTKDTKYFGYFTQHEADVPSVDPLDINYLGIGIEHKF